MASISWSDMLLKTGQGMTWRRDPSTGGGMQYAGVGVGVLLVQVGWMWSMSTPVRMMVKNSENE